MNRRRRDEVAIAGNCARRLWPWNPRCRRLDAFARLSTLAVLVGLIGCSRSEDPGSDGQSHWLSACSATEACEGGLSCLCGRCTAECTRFDECNGTGAICHEAQLVCGADVAAVGMCTRRCEETSGCPGGMDCRDERCVVRVETAQNELRGSDAGPLDTAPSPSVSAPSAIDAGGSPDAATDAGLPPPGSDCSTGFVLQLTPNLLADRLSAALFDAPVDDAFVERVQNADLNTSGAVGCFVSELLTEPEARRGIERFYGEWLDIEREAFHTTDDFPEYTELADAALRDEALRFTSSVTLDDGGTLTTLLTAQFGFANTHSAPIYGLDVEGEELQRTDYSATGRFGIFGQGFFLATRAHPLLSSPTQRGLTLAENTLCVSVPPPPASVDRTPPAMQPTTTTRALYDQHSADPACAACHRLFDPLGFALENFDAIGRYREQEQGFPIDSSGTVTLDGEVLSFSGTKELMLGLAASPEVQRCFTSQWLEHLIGRELGAEEDAIAEQVTVRARREGALHLVPAMIAGTESELFLTP